MNPPPAIAQTPGREDIQGNILKGHGRTYTALLFFRFARRAEAAQENRRLLRDAANRARPEIALTSAAEQQLHAAQFKADVTSQAEFRSLGLTARGLAACGFAVGQNLEITGTMRTDQFWEGATPGLLGDGHGENWDPGFAMNPDGVFLLAHDDAPTRDRMADDAGRILREQYGTEPVAMEPGFRWKPLEKQGDPATYEHFGFADGFARTAMVAGETSPLRHLVEDGAGFVKNFVEPFEIPLEQVMFSEAGPFLGGSFLVVHKLEQNVRAFLLAERVLQARRGALPDGTKPRDAGALFIGRERDGTPLAKGATGRTDRFHFGADPNGSRCPFSAHVRKMNPRQNKMRGDPHPHSDRREQKAAQFVRRGVLYGDESRARLIWDDPNEAPAGNVGLLFMGYMAQIGAQFLNMYLTWGPDPDFPQGTSRADALLGGSGQEWDWPQHPTFVDPKPLTLGKFLTSKGAGFFVVPPLPWLKNV